MSITTIPVLAPDAALEEIQVFATELNSAASMLHAAAIYKEYGCLVVRGLMESYIAQLQRDIEETAQRSIALLDRARKTTEGWVTPDGTLFLSTPPGYDKILGRDKQLMVLGLRYTTSAAFFRSAFDDKVVDIVSAILGDNVELFMDGQCLYKEPVGGHPKNLHQDSAYFEHRYQGPVAVLNYVVDTDLQNGALHVVPGSHQMGALPHIDTFSHLGLDTTEWPWERSLPICGQAGDSIFFNYRTVHGSKENFSDKPRPVFIHRYRRPDDYIVISATTAEGRDTGEKKLEQHGNEVKKNQQQGVMVRGFRPYVD